MKLVRPALCVALAASLAAAGVAGAATKPKPKPVCNLVTDPTGDASLTISAPVGPSEAGLDLRGADIAGNSKILTAALRLAKLETPQTAPLGYSIVLFFSAPDGDVPLYFRYSESQALGTIAEYGYDDATNGLTPLGDAAAILDTKKNEIRLTAPTSGFSDHATIKTGTKLSGLHANTSRDGIVLLLYADEATGSKSYAVGQPSCVIPGK